jgi:hypothetical protein
MVFYNLKPVIFSKFDISLSFLKEPLSDKTMVLNEINPFTFNEN